jgi:DNA-binding response OmpR family regulator
MTKPILLVEDDPNDVFFFKCAMKKESLASPLQVASDGQQAIDYLQGAGKFADREEYPLPYLVVLDLKLPFVMGLDVLKWIRQQPQLSPIVVILSSSQEDTDITAAYRLGANGYLVKSPDFTKLQDMVRAINDFWLTSNQSQAKSVVADRLHSHRQALTAAPYRSKPRAIYENNHCVTPSI